MTNEKIPLVFFGSGPVAAESLRLLSNTFDIEAIITKPTTEQELGSAYANAHIFTVSSRLELDTLISSRKFKSSLAVLIDFGIIVSQKVIDSFNKGIINSHFSLLPELRGADPISFAILEGKSKTGVSLMLLVEAMDEGPILSIGVYELNGTETTPTLTRDLIQLSYSLLENSIPKYLSGEIPPANQDFIANEFKLTPSYTRKLTKSEGIIDWSKPVIQIEREIRAFSGWPKSRTSINGIDCVITKASVSSRSGRPGDYIVDGKNLTVFCAEGALNIERLKPAGKKEMDIAGFLAGYRNRL